MSVAPALAGGGVEGVRLVHLVHRDYGNGVTEVTSVIRAHQSEVPPEPPPRERLRRLREPDPWQSDLPGIPQDPRTRELVYSEDEGRFTDRASSVKRSKRLLRRRACMQHADCIMTLTYRDNVQDRARVVADHKEFCRRVSRYIPGFSTTTVLERQKRGALHLHLLTRRPVAMLCTPRGLVRTNKLLAGIWLAVSGGGNYDSGEYVQLKGGGRRRRRPGGSPLKSILYASKYVGKAAHDSGVNALGERRFLRFGSVKAPVIRHQVYPLELREVALAEFYRLHHGASELQTFAHPDGELLWGLSYKARPS